MRLNPDLIRDILFTAEEETSFCMQFWYSPNSKDSKKWDDFPRLKEYSYEEVCYHLQQCDDAGYFSGHSNKESLVLWLTGGFMVMDLSPLGHEFINAVREDTNWNKVKTKAKRVGSFSLGVLQEIAASVIAAQMNKALGETK